MADKRMFSKSIIESDLFIDMPVSARLLYYDLGMRGDDDGFVDSPKRVLRMTGASDDDLKILIVKQFLIPFDSGVVVIRHWKLHNYIRSDRYKPTRYQAEKKLLYLDETNVYCLLSGFLPTDNHVSTECLPDVIPHDNQMSTECLPTGSIEENRLDKSRGEENRLDKSSKTFSSPDFASGEMGGGENQQDFEHKKIEPSQTEPDIKSKGRHPRHYEHDSKYYKAAVWLRDKFAATSKNKIRAPTEANLQSCADTFRLMETSDELSWKDIKAVLAWATDNEFWRKNVQSASSFRKHYNRLVADMESPISTRASPKPGLSDKIDAAYQEIIKSREEKNG